MWRKIAEVTAATLVALSLWSTHAPGVERECVTPAMYIKAIDMGLPLYDLTGSSFEEFNKNLSAKIGPPPPGMDELLVFARPEDGTSRYALLVLFQNGCAFSHVVVPLQEFLEIYGGKS